jgi:hypothetical protein
VPEIAAVFLTRFSRKSFDTVFRAISLRTGLSLGRSALSKLRPDWDDFHLNMPIRLGFLTLPIVVGAIAAILLSPSTRFQSPFLHTEQTYCYESVKTSAYEKPSPQCFSVTPHGTISRVWKLSLKDLPRNTHLRNGSVIPGLWVRRS